jgi:hypothetical protein
MTNIMIKNTYKMYGDVPGTSIKWDITYVICTFLKAGRWGVIAQEAKYST